MTGGDDSGRWALTLYVSGVQPHSMQAIEVLRRICDEELDGIADLEVIDVHDQPALVVRDQVLVAPTLVRRLPAPLRRFVGDLSDIARLRLALGLEKRPGPGESGPGQPAGHAGPGLSRQ